MVASNIDVGNGEIDLLALDGRERVVVEVRATTGATDPIDAIDHAKRKRVTRLAIESGADRVDLVGVRMGSENVDVHWLPRWS